METMTVGVSKDLAATRSSTSSTYTSLVGRYLLTPLKEDRSSDAFEEEIFMERDLRRNR